MDARTGWLGLNRTNSFRSKSGFEINSAVDQRKREALVLSRNGYSIFDISALLIRGLVSDFTFKIRVYPRFAQPCKHKGPANASECQTLVRRRTERAREFVPLVAAVVSVTQ
jgi:hypothetical protein